MPNDMPTTEGAVPNSPAVDMDAIGAAVTTDPSATLHIHTARTNTRNSNTAPNNTMATDSIRPHHNGAIAKPLAPVGDGAPLKSLTTLPRPRDRILEAGFELFGTIGYEATTIQAICRLAGVSTRDFYRLVGDRIKLFGELLERELLQVYQPILPKLRSQPQEVAGIARTWLEHWVGRLTSDPRRYRIIYAEAFGVSPVLDRRRRQEFVEAHKVIAHFLGNHAVSHDLAWPPGYSLMLADAISGACRAVMEEYFAGDLVGADVDTLIEDLIALAVTITEHWQPQALRVKTEPSP